MSYLYHLLKWLWCLQSFVKYHTFVELSFIEYKTLPNMLSQQVAYLKKKGGKRLNLVNTSRTPIGVNSTYTVSRLIFLFLFVSPFFYISEPFACMIEHQQEVYPVW